MAAKSSIANRHYCVASNGISAFFSAPTAVCGLLSSLFFLFGFFFVIGTISSRDRTSYCHFAKRNDGLGNLNGK